MSESKQQLIVNDGQSQVDDSANPESSSATRRRYSRYDTTKVLVVVPVLPDGTLDWERRCDGHSVNVSEGGMAMEVDCPAELLPRALLVGVEGADGRMHYTGVIVRYSKATDSGTTFIGAEFGGTGDAYLDDQQLTPRFNPQMCKVEYALPQHALDQLSKAGVLERTVCDRVMVCPRCRALPTFRQGCRKCGSARVERDRLIHHFACAHVGRHQTFETPAGLVCPKCQTDRLVAGADFEYLHGEFNCRECDWRDASLEMIAHCLSCNHRFSADQTEAKDLYTYRAARLNWRIMVDEPKLIGNDESQQNQPIEGEDS